MHGLNAALLNVTQNARSRWLCQEFYQTAKEQFPYRMFQRRGLPLTHVLRNSFRKADQTAREGGRHLPSSAEPAAWQQQSPAMHHRRVVAKQRA